MSAPHYLLPTDETRVRPLRNRVSGDSLMNKRFIESYKVPFLLLGASPITFAVRCVSQKRYKDAAKGSAFALCRTWAIHFTHTSLACLVIAARKPWSASFADEYDAADRRIFFNFARLFSLVKIPRWVAFLVGNEPVDDDELFFDGSFNFYGQTVSPFAAAQDSLKRNALYDISYIVVEAASTLIAEKAGLDNEVYGIATRVQLPRRISSKVASLVAGEIGCAVGRMITPRSCDGEFWCELVGRLFVGPYVAGKMFGAEVAPAAAANKELQFEGVDSEEKPLLAKQ